MPGHAAEVVEFGSVHVAKFSPIFLAAEHVSVGHPAVEYGSLFQFTNGQPLGTNKGIYREDRFRNLGGFAASYKLINLVGLPRVPCGIWGEVSYAFGKKCRANSDFTNVGWRSSHVCEFDYVSQMLSAKNITTCERRAPGFLIPTSALTLNSETLKFRNDPGAFCVNLRIGSFLRGPSSHFLMWKAVTHSLRGFGTLSGLFGDSQQSQYNYPGCSPVSPSKEAVPTWQVPFGIVYILLGMLFVRFSGDSAFVRLCGILCSLLGGAFVLNGYVDCQPEHQDKSSHVFQHSRAIVLQKYLDKLHYCSTVISMANVLSKDKQIAVIGALAEGSSIRSIERLTGVHRDTIMRLGVRVGKGCEMLLDSKMQDLDCNYLQFDEVWGFIGKKERHVGIDDDPTYGDVWTYCAIDSETKLVPAFKCGKRNLATTTEFVRDVAGRMRHRVQISSDAMHSYAEAVENAFGSDVDYGQCVKVYVHDDAQHPERKYSAPHFASAMRRPITGEPEMDSVSTSHVERLNATTRLHVKRLSRLTLAFSKKLENFQAAVALHFAYYNFVRRHNSLRCAPAMAAGVERDFLTVADLVEVAA